MTISANKDDINSAVNTNQELRMSFLNKLKEKFSRTYIEEYELSCEIKSSISVFDLSYDIDSEALMSDIDQFRKDNPISMTEYNPHTNVSAWHSDYFSHKKTNIFRQLVDVSIDKLKQCSPIAPMYLGDPYLLNIWINMYEKSDHVERHLHNYNGYSTVYFVRAESDSTPLVFDNNNFFNKKEIKITPKPGMLICFPSYMYHTVPSINGAKRISVAANYLFHHHEALVK